MTIAKIMLTDTETDIVRVILESINAGEPSITYTELGSRLRPPVTIVHFAFGKSLEDIGHLCKDMGLPLITVKVVLKNERIPDMSGFRPLYNECYPDDLELSNNEVIKKERTSIRECKSKDWQRLADYLGIDICMHAPLNHVADVPVFPDEEVSYTSFLEGSVKTTSVNAYERNRDAREKCLAHYGYRCSVCGLEFGEKYGREFAQKIHVHHLVPLASVGHEYLLDPIKDLRPVCPNCHMIIHSKGNGECYTIDEVKTMIQKSQDCQV